MKNHYLIDYENVSDEGLDGFSRLPETDVVELFYTQNANKIPIEFFSEVQTMERHAVLRFVPVAAGNQALDMQLGSYLGYLLAKNDERFVIVSRDKGYTNVISFWNARLPGVVIEQHGSIADSLAAPGPAPAEAKVVVKKKKEASAIPETKKTPAVNKTGSEKSILNARVQKTLSEAGFDSKLISHVASFVVRNSTAPQAKSVIHTEIVRMFGQEKGNTIYGLIKGLL